LRFGAGFSTGLSVTAALPDTSASVALGFGISGFGSNLITAFLSLHELADTADGMSAQQP
jgi:hypothetical protein